MLRRTQTSIGLDIGSHSIKVVELRHTPKGVFLTHSASKELPFEATAGKRNEEVIAEKIRALFQEENIKTKKVFIGVSGAQVTIRRMSLPSMPGKELKEAVKWEARRFISFPPEEAIVEFELLGEIAEQGANKLDLMVTVAEGHFIEEQRAVIGMAGLEPEGMIPLPYALWHCAEMIPEAREGIIALIDIGAAKTTISIVKENRLEFAREIATAGNSFTDAAKEAAALESTVCSFSEAEGIKKECGIPKEQDFDGTSGHVSLQKISFAVRPVLERLLSNITLSFEYYKTQSKQEEKVSRVFVSGGGAKLDGLKEYMADQLGIRVDSLSPYRGISPTLAIATGLAQGRAKAINLLPKTYRVGGTVSMKKYAVAALVCLVLFALIGEYLKVDEACTEYRQELRLKQAELADLQSTHVRLVQSAETKKRLDEEELVVPSVSMEQPPWGEILEEISHIVPRETTLTGLFMNIGKTGKELRVKGVSFGEAASVVGSIVEIMDALESSPFFSEVRLSSSEENHAYNKPGADFEVVCKVVF